ncbi:MAG: lytic transglycosylase domain-containing protein [Nanobdellota archaeon]
MKLQLAIWIPVVIFLMFTVPKGIESITGMVYSPSEHAVQESELTETQQALYDDLKTRFSTMDEFAHTSTVDLIVKKAEELGLPEPYLYAGLFYVESDYFSESPIRCENNYEEPYIACTLNEESKRCADKKSFYDLCTSHCDDSIYCTADNIGGHDCTFETQSGKKFHQFSCSYGLTQIMYPVALDLGYTGPPEQLVEDDEKAIELSLRLFRRNLNQLESEFPDQDVLVDAVLAYNMGAGTVESLKRKYGPGIDSYINHVKDVQGRSRYIGRILVFREVLRDIHLGHDLKDLKQYVKMAYQRFNFDPPSHEESLRSTVSQDIGFSVSIPYDMDQFQKVRSDAKILADSCTDINALDLCIDETTRGFEFDWGYGSDCLTENEDYFYRMVESIRQCMATPGDACTCQLPQGVGRFTLKESSVGTMITGQISGEEFQETLDIGLRDPNEYIEFPHDLSDHEIRIINGKTELHLVTVPYKPTVEKYLAVGDELSVVEQEDACITPPKTTYRFCVDTGSFKHRFALTFRSNEAPLSVGTMHNGHLTTKDTIITKVGGLIQ